jgi:maleylpyruvate isomerase
MCDDGRGFVSAGGMGSPPCGKMWPMTSEGPLADDAAEAMEAAAGIELCREGHRRLIATVSGLDDETVGRPSLLPGWTVGHVLSHVARNAEGHTRRLEGALRGEEVPRYPGGSAQRESDIEAGAPRGARELAADVTSTAEMLEDVWTRSAEAGWPARDLMANDRWRTPESPWRRLREVEVHHADLGLDYGPEDWPEDYLRWELPRALATVPGRIEDPGDARQFLAWLIGRRSDPGSPELGPWD